MKKEMINKILRVVWVTLISGIAYFGPTIISKMSYISIPEIRFSSPVCWGIGVGILIALLLPLFSGSIREQLKHKVISTLPIIVVGLVLIIFYLLNQFGFRIKVDKEFLKMYRIFVSVGILINVGLTLKKLLSDDLPDFWNRTDWSWFRKKEPKKSNGNRRKAAAEEARRAAAEEAERKEVVIKADYF